MPTNELRAISATKRDHRSRARKRRQDSHSTIPRFSLVVQYALPAQGLPPRAKIRRWVSRSLEQAARITVRFVGQEEARTLNRDYRGKDRPTNVLTFVYDALTIDRALSGDIVVCVEELEREAAVLGRSVAMHCAHLVVHGVLHLQGYDHESEPDAEHMEAREAAILASFGFPDPYYV